MFVLKRKVLESAIALLQKERAEAVLEAEKEIRERTEQAQKKVPEMVSAYAAKLEKIQKDVAEAKSKFNSLSKSMEKGITSELIEKFNHLPDSFGNDRYSFNNPCFSRGIPDLPTSYPQDAKIATLHGLLALVDGEKVELSNAIAEKILGKTDILGLLR